MCLNTRSILKLTYYLIDYDTFLSDDFDANKYATSIITESSNDATDINVELSKLAFSIDIVNKQIQEQVIITFPF
jgi:hypothetical protein